MTKMTYVAAIEAALTYLPDEIDDEVRERLITLRDQLVKRNSSSSSKPTKTQKENEDTKSLLLSVMACGESHTVTEWQDMDETLSALSNQKVSALMRQLVTDGRVTKTVDKRRALFTAVAVEG